MALYYSPEKGLTQDRNAKGATLLFLTHDEKGFKTIEATVPNSNVSIKIHSNFHYGKRSCLYAIMYDGDKLVPNFSELNMNNSFEIISVAINSDSWDVLFRKVIKQYENLHTGEKDINSYFDVLDSTITIDKSQEDREPSCMLEANRQGDLRRALRRLAEIADKIDNTIFFSSKILSQRLTYSSNLLVRTILKNSDLVKKTYDYEWEKNLTSVLNYLHRGKTTLDILLELTKE